MFIFKKIGENDSFLQKCILVATAAKNFKLFSSTQLVRSDTLRYDQFCFKPSSNILKYYTFSKFNSLNVENNLIVNLISDCLH